jgi:hypothetical protein
MAKTLASQARDGGSIPLARSPAAAALGRDGSYQACVCPQLGQPTVVETVAVKATPQPQL